MEKSHNLPTQSGGSLHITFDEKVEHCNNTEAKAFFSVVDGSDNELCTGIICEDGEARAHVEFDDAQEMDNVSREYFFNDWEALRDGIVNVWELAAVEPAKPTAREINDAKAVLEHAGNIVILWHIDDVRKREFDVNEDKARLITDDDAQAILYGIKENHDCNHGITWDDIDAHTNAYFEDEDVPLALSAEAVKRHAEEVFNMVLNEADCEAILTDIGDRLDDYDLPAERIKDGVQNFYNQRVLKMPNEEFTDKADVRKWMIDIVRLFKLGLSVHPDDPFTMYLDSKGDLLFKGDCYALDTLMGKAFKLAGEDVYTYALEGAKAMGIDTSQFEA
jgi:hypothetical protein